jgi:hypothetical protein
VKLPVDGYLNGFTVAVRDAEGNAVPQEVIHHLNFIDPTNRELFLPISRRFLAVGKETGRVQMPAMLFGIPIRRGQPMVVSSMLHNPLGRDYKGVKVSVSFTYVPARRAWPLFRAYPFQMDVLFPYGDKAFDLPPGRTEVSWEARPAIPGRIMLISGHVHEHATSLTVSDATSGKVLWEGRPSMDSAGKVASMPVTYFVSQLGLRLDPSHTYRVRVVYENPTGDTLRGGGMGVVGGLFLPALNARWPGADTGDSLYVKDRQHYMRVSLPGR